MSQNTWVCSPSETGGLGGHFETNWERVEPASTARLIANEHWKQEFQGGKAASGSQVKMNIGLTIKWGRKKDVREGRKNERLKLW